MEITKNKAVTVQYTLKGDAGDVLDSSDGREALTYIQGVGNMIPGFETGLEGKKAGDKLSFTVKPEDAYGLRDDSLLFGVPRERFEGIDDLQVGMQFQVQTQGGAMVMTVANIEDANVTLDGNHPLAGHNLNFDVEVVGVRDATEEELNEATSCGETCGPSCGCAGDDPGMGGCGGGCH